MSNDINYLSAVELVEMLKNKQVSATELLDASIAQIDKFNTDINAVVVQNYEQARLAAKSADEMIAQGESKPLLGLPITVKESFNVKGLTTTWGNPKFVGWVPEEDALVISRLRSAGAIIIGKTNVPSMLSDWQTYNEIYGTTNNPWNIKLTPGGSSGGSAAALAAGFVSLELGSDLAGSIRVPAHFCGVYGHRPSVNLVPMRGATPPPAPPSTHSLTDFPVAGPMARTADDLALALRIIAGPDDEWEGNGYKLSLPLPRHHDIRNFRVLVLKEHPLCQTANSTRQIIDQMVNSLEKENVKLSMVSHDVPDLAEIARTFVSMFGAFASANKPEEEFQKLQLEAECIEMNDMSLKAEFLRGSAISYRAWLELLRKRNALRQQWRQLFKEFDVIVCPVMPTPAFPHDHSEADRQIEIDGKKFEYSSQYAWISIASLFGLPATVLPVGYTQDGLPIGVQVIGDYLEDYTTIQFAKLLSELTPQLKYPKKL